MLELPELTDVVLGLVSKNQPAAALLVPGMQSLGCRAEGMHVPCRAWSPPREETQPLPKYAKN